MTRHSDFEPLLNVEEANLENQLLHLELQVVRGKLKAAEDELPGSRSGTRAGGRDYVVVDKAEYDDLLMARSNLRWLVRRLGTAPLGPVLRLRPGFRRLEQKWATESKGRTR